MSFDFPASVERDIERYARAENISPTEAAIKLVQHALKLEKRRAIVGELTDAEWHSLQEADPGIAFFAKMPETVIDSIAEASRQTRSERFTPRA